MARHKYNAKPTTVDGVRFSSRREARRYGELRLLQKVGRIQELRLQVPYPLVVNGVLICTYIADFLYEEGGKETTEDAKGVRTPAYKIKKKLMKALHGIDIKET